VQGWGPQHFLLLLLLLVMTQVTLFLCHHLAHPPAAGAGCRLLPAWHHHCHHWQIQ
jgi:hypothetical protein